MDRRAIFFLVSALVCALLTPVTDDAYRWVPIATCVLYVVLAAASFLDDWSRKRSS